MALRQEIVLVRRRAPASPAPVTAPVPGSVSRRTLVTVLRRDLTLAPETTLPASLSSLDGVSRRTLVTVLRRNLALAPASVPVPTMILKDPSGFEFTAIGLTAGLITAGLPGLSVPPVVFRRSLLPPRIGTRAMQ